MDITKLHPHKLKWCHILVILFCWNLAASRHCDHHHYWDSTHRTCRPCTKCPRNEIIRKPCGRHTNTICGPFREFSFFNQDDLESTYTSYEYEVVLTENSSLPEQGREFGGKADRRQNVPVVEKDDEEYWKSLAFALIGVVCVLIFVATAVVLMACRKLHETAALKQPEDDDDEDSGYVVIRAIRPPNRQPNGSPPPSHSDQSSSARALLMDSDLTPASSGYVSQRQELSPKGAYTPVRHLLNYIADDVFESEDSLGSLTSLSVAPQPVSKCSGVADCEGDSVSVSSEVPV